MAAVEGVCGGSGRQVLLAIEPRQQQSVRQRLCVSIRKLRIISVRKKVLSPFASELRETRVAIANSSKYVLAQQSAKRR